MNLQVLVLPGDYAIHKTGTPFPEETARLAQEADAIAAMLEYSFGLKEEAAAVNAAVETVLRSGKVTADLRPAGSPATTEVVGEAVCAAIG